MRICSPPIQHQCFFGVDMAAERVIGARLDVEGSAGTSRDTLVTLARRMVSATGGTREEHCTACFTATTSCRYSSTQKSVLETEPA